MQAALIFTNYWTLVYCSNFQWLIKGAHLALAQRPHIKSEDFFLEKHTLQKMPA